MMDYGPFIFMSECKRYRVTVSGRSLKIEHRERDAVGELKWDILKAYTLDSDDNIALNVLVGALQRMSDSNATLSEQVRK